MFIIRALKTIVIWGWSPILITALAITGIIYEWEVWQLVTMLSIILVIGLIIAIVRSSERQLETLSMRLRQLSGHFNRRFTGSSSLSIFAIIDTLFNVDDPQLWDWARACDMSARVFTTWCESFGDRIESDNRTGRFRIYLRSYVNELWLLNNHYYEFIEQFYEIAEKVDIPVTTKDQYNRFAVEYNSFIQNFRDSIAELRRAGGTEIEPPSVKLAKELPGAKSFRSYQDEESSFQ
ncbi:hypothetical protein ACFLYQ_03725 [Chloroflexota bacterium]